MMQVILKQRDQEILIAEYPGLYTLDVYAIRLLGLLQAHDFPMPDIGPRRYLQTVITRTIDESVDDIELHQMAEKYGLIPRKYTKAKASEEE